MFHLALARASGATRGEDIRPGVLLAKAQHTIGIGVQGLIFWDDALGQIDNLFFNEDIIFF